MKRFTSFFLASAMVLAMNTPVLAETNNIIEDLNGDNVKISGTLNKARKKQVTIQVLKPGRTISELYGNEPAAFGDVVAYQGQVESDENGNFVFDFVIKGDPEEKYSYFITATGFETEDEFDYYGSGYVDVIVGHINGSRQDKTAVEALINDNYNIINIKASLYEKMKAEDAENVGEIFEIFKNYSDAKDNIDISTQLNKSVAVYYVNKADENTKMDKAVGDYATELGISGLSAYKAYTDIIKEKSDILSAVLSKLIDAGDFKTDKKFAEFFETTAIVTAFNKVEAWSEMKELLEITADKTGISFDKCEALSYPEKVYLKLLGESVDKISDIKSEFDSAVSECKSDEKQSSSSGSSGGSGGSGGGRGGSMNPSAFAPNNIQNVSSDFFDLEGFEWAEDDIYFLKEKKIIAGKTETTFEPGAAITREEFVKLIVLVAGLGSQKNDESFVDVEKGSWYEAYIDTAVAKGIVNGIGNGRFGVGSEISREDMAVMVQRLLKFKSVSLNGADEVSFADANAISDYAQSAVTELARNGILLGMDDGRFAPSEKVTRAQAAVLLKRVYNLIQGEA